MSYSELQRVRQRELQSLQQPRSSQELARVGRSKTQDDDLYEDDAFDRASRSTARRKQYPDDGYYDRRSRRRDSAPDYGDVDDSRRRRRRRDYDSQDDNQNRQQQTQQQYQQQQYRQPPYQKQQQTQQQRPKDNQAPAQPNDDADDEDGERQYFDRSSDGLISAAAGAALGAITTRHFASPKDFSAANNTPRGRQAKNWKMLAGAVAGAAAFNMGEQAIKTYFEDQVENVEDMQSGGELLGEMMAAVGPDIL